MHALEAQFSKNLETASELNCVSEKSSYAEATTNFKRAASEANDSDEENTSISPSKYIMTGIAGMTLAGLGYLAMKFRNSN